MKTTKKRIIAALLAAAMAAAALPVTAAAESLSETAVSAEYGAKKLPAPKNITASRTANAITLQWDAVKGADRYRVYMYNENTGKYEKYKNVSKTSCKVSGLSAKTKYKFKIAALVEKDGKYSVQTKTPAINVTTKKASASDSSSVVPTFVTPVYGDTKSKVFASMGGEKYFTKDKKDASSYRARVNFSGSELECAFKFNANDQIEMFALDLGSEELGQVALATNLEQLGEPYRVQQKDKSTYYTWVPNILVVFTVRTGPRPVWSVAYNYALG